MKWLGTVTKKHATASLRLKLTGWVDLENGQRPPRPVSKKAQDSKYRGVHRKGTRWSATITIGGLKKTIGIYDWETMAALCYDLEVMNSGWPTSKIQSSLNFQDPDSGAVALAAEQAAGPQQCRQCKQGPAIGEAQLCRICWDKHYSQAHEHMLFDDQDISSDSSDSEEQPRSRSSSNWTWQQQRKWTAAPHDAEILQLGRVQMVNQRVTFAAANRMEASKQLGSMIKRKDRVQLKLEAKKQKRKVKSSGRHKYSNTNSNTNHNTNT